MPPRARIRDLGVRLGVHPTGPENAITDVAGVLVGHSTVVRGAAGPRGTGVARTGVTAILPRAGQVFHDRVLSGAFVLNGAGEVAGLTQLQEWGLIETPILLTSTLSVGRVADATVKHLMRRFPGIGAEHDVILPIVGECDDSWLNDVSGDPLNEEHVFHALDTAATGPVVEGCVGGGTGMVTCHFAGGIGTSSRVVPSGHTVGVLVLSNFGRLEDLRVDGVPVGAILAPRYAGRELRERIYGSIIAVVATDAPLLTPQLSRVAKRAALGIGRAGSYAAHGSGEIVLAFSTANTVPREASGMVAHATFLLDSYVDPIFQAAIEATEEAILNAITAASEQDGVDGHIAPALPLDAVGEIVGEYAGLRATLVGAP